MVSVSLKAYRSVPPELLAGQVVIDTCNYYPQRDGHIAALDNQALTSSELIQRHLAGAPAGEAEIRAALAQAVR